MRVRVKSPARHAAKCIADISNTGQGSRAVAWELAWELPSGRLKKDSKK
jgi:hypothetical protein